ncbi:MAG: cytidine deaminase [Brevundimonas sp.]|uniref:cytidine deaminase n=1 Tax=Brevundimonas sp. TaxID=1871086 RepID=UPI00271C4541|nr:cytidine deaminase [Brevundimonas sp.]MDO9077072.1 cytidine deaminase [Brevundimonas sp.]MDP3079397.1 cytidine deaminase [Brevundimonas sp.]MDZ4060638.1 cytidine deaminase [Brevundimonas sp.]
MNHPQLIEEALIARAAAYAPYSRFEVGAAVLCSDGRVFRGCNVENASYGLCSCAERTALFSAIAAGYRPGEFSALAVVGPTEGPVSPCGACRQVILELGGATMSVICANLTGQVRVDLAGDLLPGAFDGACLTVACHP